MPKHTGSEASLIDQAVQGDHAALERLLLAEYERLHAAIDRKLPSDVRRVRSAEDILQETFVDAFRYISSFEVQGDDAFYRWLATIAKHRLLDAVKAHRAAKRGGGQVVSNAQVADWTRGVAGLVELAAVTTHTPSRSAVNHEAAAAVRVALATIPEQYREALRLRYMEGLDVAAIAERMERTPRAVHMLCNRGLKALREAVGRASQFMTSS